MKYFTPLPALLAATPALAHHEAEIAATSPTALMAGLAVIALAGLVAFRQRRTR
ncbi:hypothetical protein [uncultured Roseobacter sp.]|uniref:hypothetical protein n=1 Tax=uncultured Roseobacter sp. TaxID=114847 RepID=UPI00262FBCEC|nr:hypothetical protein [uncultured Roseobacter sp.]